MVNKDGQVDQKKSFWFEKKVTVVRKYFFFVSGKQGEY